jgi:2-C-methyl-D-erythritol 4-phosphate cytidylyltransferase
MKIKVVAIVPAAGLGKRLGTLDKKPFVKLAGKPLIAHTLKALESSAGVDNIIVAAEAGSIKRLEGIISRYGFKKIGKVVKGGRTRAESVKNCFKKINGPCDIVVIHDGARPFPGIDSIKDCIRLAGKFGGCISAIPATDTIKLADRRRYIVKTLDRNYLWRAQTPQAFKYELLKYALGRIRVNSTITDDASMLEHAGNKVKILEGSVKNIKITAKEDLKIAEALLNTI